LGGRKTAAIVGSLVVEEKGNYFNRLYFVKPNGEYFYYNKRHLFRMAEEDKYYTMGNSHLLVEYKGWKILPLVCYDLRFPVWSRNNINYDLLIYVANWPERRNQAWKTLLKARAIENLSYTLGVNRIGNDGNGVYHSGDSALIDYKGNKISKTKAHEENLETLKISRKELLAFRQKFPAHQDADSFSIK
jgi:predicted amidohydrolase